MPSGLAPMVSLLTWLRILPPKMRHTHLILRPFTPDHIWQTLRCLPPWPFPHGLPSSPGCADFPQRCGTQTLFLSRTNLSNHGLLASIPSLRSLPPHLAAELAPKDVAHGGDPQAAHPTSISANISCSTPGLPPSPGCVACPQRCGTQRWWPPGPGGAWAGRA